MTKKKKETTTPVPLRDRHWLSYWSGEADPVSSTTTTTAGRKAATAATTATSRTYLCRHRKHSSRRRYQIWLGRIIFVTLLAAVAVISAIVTHRALRRAEEDLSEIQFESIAARALKEAQGILHRRRWAGVTMAAILGDMYPNASQWPFVDVLQYERLARGLLNTSDGVDMGFAPFLFEPETQGPLFEEFAYNVYTKLGWPNTTAQSSFGRGIWAQRRDENGNLQRYHDKTGKTPYPSNYTVLTPLFRTDDGPTSILLFNTHSGKVQGEGTDRMIDCSLEREKAFLDGQTDVLEGASPCGSTTDLFPVVGQNNRWGAALLNPVYPLNDPLRLVAYHPTLFMVDELLTNIFGDETSGIDAVIETENLALTFSIMNGFPVFVGQGNFQDKRFDNLRQKVKLVDNSLFTEASPSFSLSFSPNTEFDETYETTDLIFTGAVAVGMIVVTSLFFFLYDFCRQKEANYQKELLEARRQFMRFVSHEVRSPLQVMSLGLDMLQTDLAKVLGIDRMAIAPGAFDVESRDNKSTTDSVPKTLYSDASPKSDTSSQVGVEQKRALEWYRLTQEIETNTLVAVDILNDLLNYDRIEQGNLQLQLKLISGWELVEKVTNEFRLACASKSVNLELSFAGVREVAGDKMELDGLSTFQDNDLPDHIKSLVVVGDSIRLTQTIRNLLSNAVKFTSEGGSICVEAAYDPSSESQSSEKIQLSRAEEISAVRKGLMWIDVRDTGVGLSSDQISRLFRDGSQINPNELQSGGGSGLGLYIARGIVEQHNGKIKASSEGLGHGSTFSVSLPVWKVIDIAKVETEGIESQEVGSTTIDKALQEEEGPSSLRLLVVEDVKSNRKLLCRLLRSKGHVCDEAENGLIAVEKVRAAEAAGTPYHSLLMDFEMPVMNGPDAANEIRELGYDVNIIGVTGNVLQEDVSHFKARGANDVIFKPVNVQELETAWKQNGVY